MLPFTFGAGGLAAVVLGAVLICGPKAMDEKKQGEDIEKALYDLLSQDGVIRFAKCPWEMDVRRVEGRKLIDTVFKRRDKTGQYYDVVAHAREAELRVHLPTKQLFLHMRHSHVAGGVVEDKVWAIDLPADLWK